MTGKFLFPMAAAALISITSMSLYGAASSSSTSKNLNIMFIGDSYTCGCLAEGVSSMPYPLQVLKYLNSQKILPGFSFSAFGPLGGSDSQITYQNIIDNEETSGLAPAFKEYQKVDSFHGILAFPGLRFKDLNYLLDNHSFADMISRVNYEARCWVKMIARATPEAPEYNAEKLLSSPVINIVVVWLGAYDMAENYVKTSADIMPYLELIKELYSALGKSACCALIMMTIPNIAVRRNSIQLANFKLFNNMIKEFYRKQKSRMPMLQLIDLNDTDNPDIEKFNTDWTTLNYNIHPANSLPYSDLKEIVSKKIINILSRIKQTT
ncbi:hypothetical protein P0136_06350 [Lentisphaerota bacterium ZTH]|nr:hypothetical protein JYG24_02540 [Lentisphaerota bacterium]WET07610.1 hypothetical protein P0136_06350 [Lentisphaerota bacterium ZTH]